MSEADYLFRAQSAESRIGTLEQANTQLKEKLRNITELFGVRTSFGGEMQIDYGKLVESLGIEQAIELRKVIDEQYRISGGFGEKPKIKVSA